MEQGENIMVIEQMEKVRSLWLEWGDNTMVMGQMEQDENIAVIHDKTNRTEDNHIKKRTPCNSTGGDCTQCVQ
jgi:hypothetical protein